MIAKAYWGRAPECGRPQVVSAALPPPTVGLADVVHCEIDVDRSALWGPAGEACMVAVHEYGHLLGFGHSPDPNDVMYPLLREPAWPCAW